MLLSWLEVLNLVGVLLASDVEVVPLAVVVLLEGRADVLLRCLV